MTTTHPPTAQRSAYDMPLAELREEYDRLRANVAIYFANHERIVSQLEAAVARRSPEGAERAVTGELTAFDVRPDESPHAVRLTVDVPAAACFAVRFLLGETLTLSALSSPTREPTP